MERTENGKDMRGQAAMEYLMTYGWALLVIVSVIAILVMLNPFSAPVGCRFDQVGFQCANPAFQGNTIYLLITNSNNNAIILQNASCTTDKSTNAPNVPVRLFTTAEGTLDRQATITLNLTCYQSGSTAPMSLLSTGNDFSGRVWIFYKNEDDPGTYPVRVVSATVTAKAS